VPRRRGTGNATGRLELEAPAAHSRRQHGAAQPVARVPRACSAGSFATACARTVRPPARSDPCPATSTGESGRPPGAGDRTPRRPHWRGCAPRRAPLDRLAIARSSGTGLQRVEGERRAESVSRLEGRAAEARRSFPRARRLRATRGEPRGAGGNPPTGFTARSLEARLKRKPLPSRGTRPSTRAMSRGAPPAARTDWPAPCASRGTGR